MVKIYAKEPKICQSAAFGTATDKMNSTTVFDLSNSTTLITHVL